MFKRSRTAGWTTVTLYWLKQLISGKIAAISTAYHGSFSVGSLTPGPHYSHYTQSALFPVQREVTFQINVRVKMCPLRRFCIFAGTPRISESGVVALSVEYRACDQEVVGSSLGRARGVKTLGMFLTPVCLCSPSRTSWYQPKGGDASRLGSKGRYGLCVGGR